MESFPAAILLAIISATAIEAAPNPASSEYSGQFHTYKIPVDDPVLGQVTRSYQLYLPKHYKQNNPVSLVLDLHGWGDSAAFQAAGSKFPLAADNEEDGFLVAFPHGEGYKGSFNCSRTDGPQGAPCVLPRDPSPNAKYYVIDSYDSCSSSTDPINSCDWTSCYDDVAFMRAIVDHVSTHYCVKKGSVHLTGMSNGGMFAYYAAEQLADILATIVPASGSPLLGFDNVPTTPISLLDIHGTEDKTIPYDQSSVYNEGVGPHGTVTSYDGYYYHPKPGVILKWVAEMNCSTDVKEFPTSLDGKDGWNCRLWTGCRGGKEVVQCVGDHGHDYPFSNDPQVAQIMWNFMKEHERANSSKHPSQCTTTSSKHPSSGQPLQCSTTWLKAKCLYDCEANADLCTHWLHAQCKRCNL